MIGTVPNARGKSLAKRMTMKLMAEAIQEGRKTCVLHASQAGERVYSKLGFTPYDYINTYTIDGDKVRYKRNPD